MLRTKKDGRDFSRPSSRSLTSALEDFRLRVDEERPTAEVPRRLERNVRDGVHERVLGSDLRRVLVEDIPDTQRQAVSVRRLEAKRRRVQPVVVYREVIDV